MGINAAFLQARRSSLHVCMLNLALIVCTWEAEASPMSATDKPFDPNSAANASPAGPQPTTHTSAVVVKGSKGCNTPATDGCSESSLLACRSSSSEGNDHRRALLSIWGRKGGLVAEHVAGCVHRSAWKCKPA